ncbi:50S ribosomal protein L25 [Candidatus Uhrbacteria bacterium]|nr:50S ribosomal protein L25 [Candidatus Uhrbacteria bacterium]
MSDNTIAAKAREIMGRKTNSLRLEGEVPAVMYGFEIEPTNLSLDRSDLERLYAKAGVSTVVSVDVDGTAHNVLIQELQRDPLTEYITHADFRRINMNEKVQTSVSVRLEGVSLAVKDMSGTLVQAIDEVDVEALPSALVREFVLDIAPLATFEDALHVSDIVVPEGMEITTDPKQTIAIVQMPRQAEAIDELDAPIEDGADGNEAAGAEGDDKKEGESNAK